MYIQRNASSAYGTWFRISDETHHAKYSEINGVFNSELGTNGNREGIRLSDGSLFTVGLFQDIWATYEIAGADTVYYKYFYLVAFILFGVSVIFPLVKLIIKKHKKGEV